MEEKIQAIWQKHRKEFLICVFAVFCLGMMAHAYQFLNFQLSHDSLDGLYVLGAENAHKIDLGRVFMPAYRALFQGTFTMPWLIGILTLVWISLGVYMVVSMFDIKKTSMIVMIGGLMTVNITVTAICATFMHDLGAYMFGTMLGCLAAWAWKKQIKGWYIIGAIGTAISIGMYQANASVTITLIMIAIILRLLEGEKTKKVILSGVTGASMVLVGGILYLLSVKAITSLTGIELASRANSVSALYNLRISEIPRFILATYVDWWDYFVQPNVTWINPGVTKIVMMLLLGIVVIAIVCALVKSECSKWNKVLSLIIILLLPLGMDTCYILARGYVHELMQYSFIFIFVLGMLLVHYIPVSFIRGINSVLIICILVGSIQTSNTCYLKKTLIAQGTLSHMTNVMYDMYQCGYESGVTTVYVVGAVPAEANEEFEWIDKINGMEINEAVTSDKKSIKSYFKHVLGENLLFCTPEEESNILSSEEYTAMPAWPTEGYIEYIDEIMVIKLQ